MPQPHGAIHTSAGNLVTEPASGLEKLLAYQPLQALTGLYGKISLGGHIHVTPNELAFIPHSLNATHTELHIPLDHITGLRPHRRLAAALLTVTTRTGHEFNLVSWKRQAIIDAVDQARSTPRS